MYAYYNWKQGYEGLFVHSFTMTVIDEQCTPAVTESKVMKVCADFVLQWQSSTHDNHCTHAVTESKVMKVCADFVLQWQSSTHDNHCTHAVTESKVMKAQWCVLTVTTENKPLLPKSTINEMLLNKSVFVPWHTFVCVQSHIPRTVMSLETTITDHVDIKKYTEIFWAVEYACTVGPVHPATY